MFQRLFGRQRQANRAITDALCTRNRGGCAARTFLFRTGMCPTRRSAVSRCCRCTCSCSSTACAAKQGASAEIAQLLIDEFFLDVDHSLRELGISDTGVPKRMKKLAKMFYGRTEAYEDALERDDHAALAAALSRNVRPDVKEWPEAALLPPYVIAANRDLAAQPSQDICAGKLDVSRRQTQPEGDHAMKHHEIRSPVSFPVNVARLPQKGHAGCRRGRRKAARGAGRGAWAVVGRTLPGRSCWSPHGSATASRSAVASRPRSRRPASSPLEPVQSKIDEDVEGCIPSRGFQARPAKGFDVGGEILLDAEGPDSPETFSGDSIDVGALAEEFFGLASIHTRVSRRASTRIARLTSSRSRANSRKSSV